MKNRIFTKEEDAWLSVYLNSEIKSFKKAEKERIEKLFNEEFKTNRTWWSLMARAKRIGLRDRRVELIVGVTTKFNKKDEPVYIYIGNNKYISKSRYMWEKLNNEKLSKYDVIKFLDGDLNNFSKENLIRMTRTENLRFNKMSNSIPVETRILLSKLKCNIDNLNGKGDWSDDEVVWVLSRKKTDCSHKYWHKLAEEFNAKFNKKRTNRCLRVLCSQKVLSDE